MTNYLIELLLLFMPGILSELLFCRLKERESVWWVRVSRILMFSMACLALRTFITVANGYDDTEINVLFHGIQNYLKYCFVSVFEIVFLPPFLLVLEKLLFAAKK